MVLHIHINASYLSEAKKRSQVGIHFLLSRNTTIPGKALELHAPPPPQNGTVHTIYYILNNVMYPSDKAKVGTLSYNSKDATSLRAALVDMGHLKPTTPTKSENTTATGITNKTVKQRCSKAIDMKLYWLQE